MEESIKRVEKLVHVTNSALAQMKYNMTFDKSKKEDLKARRSQQVLRSGRANRGTFSFGTELDEFEKEFRADANEILSKMDKILDPNHFVSSRAKSAEASRAREKMNEINKILLSRRSDVSKSSEMEQSRQKFWSLINEEDVSPRGKTKHQTQKGKISDSSNDAFPSGRIAVKRMPNSVAKTENKMEKPRGIDRSKDELKLKLLETENIVDRGFQTARQIRERVDHMTKAEKTPVSERSDVTSDVINLKSLSEKGSRKSESNETIKTVSSEKCAKCLKLKKKRRENEGKKPAKENEVERPETERKRKEKNSLVSVKSRAEETSVGKKTTAKLSLHRLPSVHIRGDLQMQKVHNLAIPGAAERQTEPTKANVSIKMLSHENIEKEKNKNLLENIKRENCFCGNNEENVNRIECFNCGKLIRVFDTPKNAKEIDKLLLQCDFNIFDPRIDEFVERFRKGEEPKVIKDVKNDETFLIEKKVDFVADRPPEGKVTNLTMENNERYRKDRKVEKVETNLKLKELSQRLTRKYKEEIDQLEDDHQEFEKILKSIFKKIDDSRKLFGFESNSEFFPCQSETEINKKRQNLTVTKPLVFCLNGNPEPSERGNVDGDDIKNKLEKSTETDRTPGEKRRKLREKRKKLDKKDVKNKFKSRTLGFEGDERMSLAEKFRKESDMKRESQKMIEEVHKNPIELSPEVPAIGAQILREIYNGKEEKVAENDERYKNDCRPSSSERVADSNSGSTQSVEGGETADAIFSDGETKTENDYESDFERESPTFSRNKNIEDVSNEVEEAEDLAINPCVKKLSTITEVDSDLEKKLSERSSSDGKTGRSGKPEMKEGSEKSSGEAENEEFKYDLENVLSKAFKKGIAYTLKRQTDVLESMDIEKKPEMVGRSLSTPRSRAGTDEMVNLSSPASPLDRPKSSRTKSESSPSQKSSSTELVASLKEVLSALKDQFDRTQSLADRLTDNVKSLSDQNEGRKFDSGITPEMKTIFMKKSASSDTDLMARLQKSPRNGESVERLRFSLKKSPFTLLENFPDASKWRIPEGTRDNGSNTTKLVGKVSADDEPSIGEIRPAEFGQTFLSDKLKFGHEKSDESSHSEDDRLKSGSRKPASVPVNKPTASPSLPPETGRNEDILSEGEIVSNIVLEDEGSSIQSIGELISESISGAS